jgi:hypothetical protein
MEKQSAIDMIKNSLILEQLSSDQLGESEYINTHTYKYTYFMFFHTAHK